MTTFSRNTVLPPFLHTALYSASSSTCCSLELRGFQLIRFNFWIFRDFYSLFMAEQEEVMRMSRLLVADDIAYCQQLQNAVSRSMSDFYLFD